MSTMKQALKQLGYKGQTKQQPASLEKIIDEAIDPITKPVKIQMQRAGSHYRARFEGRAPNCFGTTPQEAESRLRIFDNN